jgi:H+/gluconate symporter-like permease
MLGLFGIILSLVLLMYLAYRGITVLVLAPLLAAIAVLFAADLPLLATYTQVFMTAAGRFVMTYFPLFLLGALFGKLMDDSGSARTIAHWIVEKLGAERSILAVYAVHRTMPSGDAVGGLGGAILPRRSA